MNAYELYEAEYQSDGDHFDLIQQEEFDVSMLTYTKTIMAWIPFSTAIDCDPNLDATVYGFLPSFPVPSIMTNSTKYDAAYWYSENGNITGLSRNDENGVETIQNYLYSNTTNNQLDQVTWTTNGTPTTFGYQYDANGNLLEDLKNSVASIAYNSFNELPVSITNGSGQKNYRYNAQGQRIVKEVSSSDMEYYMDGIVVNGLGEVKSYALPEGYVEPNLPLEKVDYYYTITDWLGTTRSVMDENGVQLNAVDHFPFGLRMPDRNSYNSGQEGYRYQFTGHEFDGETNYGYHGARYYNRELGRYMSVDPLAKEFFGWSSYNYTMGNPINLIDPDGRAPQDIYTIDAKGHISLVKKTDKDYDMLYSAEDWGNKKYYNDSDQKESSGISLNDQNILKDLTTKVSFKERYVLSGEGNANDAYSLFKFAADNSNIEWAVTQAKIDGKVVTKVGTINDMNAAPSNKHFGFNDENTISHVHSHPNSSVDSQTEVKSMGETYEETKIGDWANAIREYNANGKTPFTKYVYFPNSSRLYNVNAVKGPTYVKKVKTFKNFNYVK